MPVPATPLWHLRLYFDPSSRFVIPRMRNRSASRFRRIRRAGLTRSVVPHGARAPRDRVARRPALFTIHPLPDVRRRRLLGSRSGSLWADPLMYLDSAFVQCLFSLVFLLIFPSAFLDARLSTSPPRLRFAPVCARLRLRLLDAALLLRLRSSSLSHSDTPLARSYGSSGLSRRHFYCLSLYIASLVCYPTDSPSIRRRPPRESASSSASKCSYSAAVSLFVLCLRIELAVLHYHSIPCLVYLLRKWQYSAYVHFPRACLIALILGQSLLRMVGTMVAMFLHVKQRRREITSHAGPAVIPDVGRDTLGTRRRVLERVLTRKKC